MLKEMLMIHPLGQTAAVVFGLFNLFTGLTRRCLILALHVNFGVLFYALMFLGAAVGALVVRLAVHRDVVVVPWFTHGLFALGFMAVLLCGALSGFLLLARKSRPVWMLALHRYSNITAVALFGVQAYTGLRALAAIVYAAPR